MQELMITEFSTTTIDFSRSYVLVLAEGETVADYSALTAEVEWTFEGERFDVWHDLTRVEDISEVLGADLDAINVELQEIAAEEQVEGGSPCGRET